MGMFTTITDDKGNSVQIKCGWDELEEYKVGDTVNWRVIPYRPGEVYLPDNVYLGCGGKEGDDGEPAYEDWWVVIKNHVVLEMFPYEDGDTFAELKARYKIQDPPEDLWPPELWEEKREQESQFEEDRKAFEDSIAHLSSRERLAAWTARLLKNRIDYAAVGRSLFGVDPLPEGAKPIYSTFDDVRPKGEPITCAKPDTTPIRAMSGESDGIHPPHVCAYVRRPVSFGMGVIQTGPEIDLVEMCQRLFSDEGEEG